ncbi:hypothetical protein IWW39_000947 [Coemansia spiralis]|uniref:Lysosomal dipeptide transporter MFSD1 n=1 Tax=Coemansia spiralis TaxID=417178 RepID=A0A9W8L6Y2_9FUNG|nr:hypothetical protein IWW39_000947 [Coemansia spiralis]
MTAKPNTKVPNIGGKRMGSSLMSPLKSTLKHDLEINNTQWASLISMVWVVGTVSPFIAGLLIDTMGAPLAGALSISLILVGNGVCAIAVGTKSVNAFLIGRAIYSTGGGAVLLVGEVIMLKWFKQKQLPLAFGCASTIGGLFSFSGPAAVTAILSRHANVAIPFWLATGLSGFGLVCFGAYALIHYSHYAQDIELVNQCPVDHIDIQDKRTSNGGKTNGQGTSLQSLEYASAVETQDNKLLVVPSQESGVYVGTEQRRHPKMHSAISLSIASKPESPEGQPGVAARTWLKSKQLFLDLSSLPEAYWHVLLCITVQGTLFIPLHEIVPEMMETEWGYSRAESSKLFVYLHIIPIVLHICLGVFINKVGHRLNLFLVGSMFVFLASIFITFVRQVPIMLSLVMMNLSGSMVPASIFSMMNLVIDNDEIAGAALGLIRSAEFASVTLMEMLDGLLQDADHNRYDTVLIGLVVFAGILLLVAIASLVVDYTLNNGVLNSANPYVSSRSSTSPSYTDCAADKVQVTKARATSTNSEESSTRASLGLAARGLNMIPKRRFVYMGTIGLLLATAWTLFIMSLTRI